MAGQIAAISSLLLGSMFLLLAAGLNGILLPVRGAIEGFSTTELGLLGTGWALGFIAATLLIPVVVSRVGHVRGYGALASLAAVSILGCAMHINPVTWVLMRVITGFCFAGSAMIVESWLNERADANNRGQVFSVYQMVHFAASTGGQFLIAARPPTDFFFFALAAIFYCLAILPTALSTQRAPAPLRTTKLNVLAIYRNSPVSAVGCILVGCANGAFGTLGPVYAQTIGLSIRDIAAFMSVALLGGALIQFPLGWISDRMDRRRVLLGVTTGAAIIGLGLALLHPRDPVILIVIATIFGMLLYPLYALIVAHANDFAAGDDFVGIAGGLLLLYGIGTVFGPILGALAMTEVSPDALFAFTAIAHGLLAAYTLVRIQIRAAPEDRSVFRGFLMPKAATPESAVLDPRADEVAETADEPPSSEEAAEDESSEEAEPGEREEETGVSSTEGHVDESPETEETAETEATELPEPENVTDEPSRKDDVDADGETADGQPEPEETPKAPAEAEPEVDEPPKADEETTDQETDDEKPSGSGKP